MIALWKSFHRFLEKFDDYERYAVKRAERLKREDIAIPPSLRDSPDRLDATHHATAFAGSARNGIPIKHSTMSSVRFAETAAAHLPNRSGDHRLHSMNNARKATFFARDA